MIGSSPLKNRPVRAVFLTFVVNGALFGTWVSRIPSIQGKLGLNEAQLGLLLLGMSVGVLIGLALASGWISLFGSRAVTIVSFGLMVAALPCLALAPHALLLWPLVLVFGGAMSVMDVAMNEQAVFVERAAGQPLMSRFHGAFSVGGLLGALVGAPFAEAGIPPVLHFPAAALIAIAGMGMAAPGLLVQTEKPGQPPDRLFCFPQRVLWPIGIVALISSIGEGAMADWSAVYVVEILRSSEGTAGLAYAAYSLAMTLARLGGDALKTRCSARMIVSLGGWVASSGLLLIVASGDVPLALVGFALVGLGLANLIPIAFTAAGNFPGVPSSVGIAGVASIGYAGFLASPPFVGLLAEATSLRLAFVTLIVLLLSLPFLARAVWKE
ncbi:MAG: MFS transporter [Verrucomicrobiota bacterium]